MAINSSKLRSRAPARVAETVTPKPRVSKGPAKLKIKDMTLDQLYEQEKITPSVKTAILEKEDFSQIQPRYCEKVCKLPCEMKHHRLAGQNYNRADVVIIQDHRAGPDGWKTAGQVNRLQETQIHTLARNAFPDSSFKVLNLVKCPNLDGDDPDTQRKKLTATQMMSCAPYLWSELRETKPKVIISLSTEVTKSLGLTQSNYNNRGEFVYSNLDALPATPVVITLHPRVLNMLRQNASGKMYGADYTSVIQRDFGKATLIMKNPVPIGGLHERIAQIISDQVFVTTTLQEVKDAMEDILRLPSTFVISWDLETTSLDPWAPDARILTCQFGYRRPDGKIQAIVIPLWHRNQTFYDADEAWALVVPVLLSQYAKVGHNVKFDIKYCAVTTGVRVVNVKFDTMLMLHSLNSGIVGCYGLKAGAWDYLPMLGLGGYEELLDETLDAEEMKRLIKLEKGDTNEDDEESDD